MGKGKGREAHPPGVLQHPRQFELSRNKPVSKLSRDLTGEFMRVILPG
jgi:hypothetical protein